MLLEAFIHSPVFGDASYYSIYNYELEAGGHLYWMSRLALWGSLGFIGYIFILKKVFESVLRIFDNNFKFYYQLSLLGVLFLGFLKNLTFREPYILLFVIIPGFYFSKLIQKDRNKIIKNKIYNKDEKIIRN